MFGWARCPNAGLDMCTFPAACLGAPNPLFYGKFLDEGHDPAKLHHNASCNRAYREDSFLCGACAAGFSRTPGDLSGKCDRCPDAETNSAIAIAGVVLGAVVLVFYVKLALNSGGDNDVSDGAKSIGLSFMQILGLLATFPIPWGRMFTFLFQIGGIVIVIGQHFVNIKCMVPSYTEADIFYATQIAWAVLPWFLLLVCLLLWAVAEATYGTSKFGRHFWLNVRTSVAALMYLIWAGLCSEVFRLFSCQNLCGTLRLVADIEEVCFVDRHQSFILLLGVPTIFVYVIGFPVGALTAVWRLHRRANLTNRRVEECDGHKTWGFLYSSFRKKTWWCVLIFPMLYFLLCV